MVEIRNIFKDGTGLKEELVETLLSGGKIDRLEGVVSPDSGTPSKIYDQVEDEWVMVVGGYAELEFEERGQWNKYIMRNGDHVTIPAHLRHRVLSTEVGTAWVALFYRD